MTLNEWQQEQTDDRDAREAYASGTTVEVVTAIPDPLFEMFRAFIVAVERFSIPPEVTESLSLLAESIAELVRAVQQVWETMAEQLQPFTMTFAYAPTGEPLFTYLALKFSWHLQSVHRAEQSRRVKKLQARARRRGRL